MPRAAPLCAATSTRPGGDLALVNLPGYGVDAFLTLRRLDRGGWQEQLDGDVAAAGAEVAVAAAIKVQKQLHRGSGSAGQGPSTSSSGGL